MDISTDIYPGYRILRPLTKLAGILGVLQSLAWIGLAITGIIAYYCMIDYSHILKVNLSTITSLTFFEIYFHGDCKPDGFPRVNFNEVRGMTVMTPKNIHVWMWVYLAMNALWLISSISLISHVAKNHLRRTNILLYLWVFITLEISAMDLGLGIIFGLDYNEFTNKANKVYLDHPELDIVSLVSAQVSSMSMLVIAFKGFILWLINVALIIYFFMETFVINDTATSRTSLIHNDFVSVTHSEIIKSPIKAYEASNGQARGNKDSVQLNVEPLQRASRMSVEALKERKDKHPPRRIDKFEQYPPVKKEPSVPDPDYTPPTPRKSTIFQPRLYNPSLKNTRYQ